MRGTNLTKNETLAYRLELAGRLRSFLVNVARWTRNSERRCFQATSAVNVKTKEIQSKLVRFPFGCLCSPYTDAKRARTRILAKVSGRSRERAAISIMDSY